MEMQYLTAAEKLEFEKTEELKKVQPHQQESYLQQMSPLFEGILKKCAEDSDFEALVLQPHKSWQRCNDYVTQKVLEMYDPKNEEKDKARNGQKPIVAMVSSDKVFEWVYGYYYLDDKAQIEKEKEEEKQKEALKQAREAKVITKQVKPKQKSKKKPSLDGQVSFFDFLLKGED